MYYIFWQFIVTKKNYSTIKKEYLEIIYIIQKFRHYLLENIFTFHIDHKALKYIVTKSNWFPRLVYWLLLLKEFIFKVKYYLKKIHNKEELFSCILDAFLKISIHMNMIDFYFFFTFKEQANLFIFKMH